RELRVPPVRVAKRPLIEHRAERSFHHGGRSRRRPAARRLRRWGPTVSPGEVGSQRNDVNAARTSVADSSGSFEAAKWPPGATTGWVVVSGESQIPLIEGAELVPVKSRRRCPAGSS